MATSSHARSPNPDDLRRLSVSAEDGDADCDREPPPQGHALQPWRRRLAGSQEPDRRL
jgi:hypothetical protein